LTSYIWTMGIAIASQVAYHLAQKAMPASVKPFSVLAVAYVLAAVLSVALAPLTGASLGAATFRGVLAWPTYLLALSIVGIEVGFLLAYRSGWSLGIAFAVASTASVVFLGIIGALWFGDALNVRRVLGLALAMVGAALIVSRD